MIDNHTGILCFYASWCLPCRNLKPIVEKVSDKYPVLFVNVDESPDVVAKYGVNSVPTVIGVNNGKEVGRLIGVKPESDIRSLALNAVENKTLTT